MFLHGDPLAVVPVGIAQAVVALLDHEHLVEGGIGDGLVGEQACQGVVLPKGGDSIRVAPAIGETAHTVLLRDIALVVELDSLRGMGHCPGQVPGAGRKQAVESVVFKGLLQVERRVGAPLQVALGGPLAGLAEQGLPALPGADVTIDKHCIKRFHSVLWLSPLTYPS